MIRSPRKRGREVVRKLFHLLYGLIIVLLFSVSSGRVASLTLGAVFLAGMALSELHRREMEMPGICDVLRMCDRHHHLKARPGLGPLRFTLGALITRLLFPARTAVASIIILTFVDAASALIGGHFGRLKVPWSEKKSIEGSLAGFLAGMIASSLVLPVSIAAAASAVAAFVESFDIDDNVPVPLAAGLVVGFLGGFR